MAAFGILFIIHVSSVNGAVLVTDTELRQAKSNVTKEPLKAHFQILSRGDGGNAAPLLYLLTGEKKYAVRARTSIQNNLKYLRKHIPYMVNIWILRSPGRVVSTLLAYDMTRESGVYTDKDIHEIKDVLSWCITHYLNEGTDHLGKGFLYQTDYFPEDMEDWVIANMNVHRLLAVGLYGFVFPEEPRSNEIRQYTVDYFERILSLGARQGGAWAENPRYMGGVLRELFILAAGLKNAGERDFFMDERFKKMLGFFAESIPVPGTEGQNKPTMVAADDSHWWENRATILSWAASRYYESEPELAGELIWCWQKLNAPLATESLLFVNPDIEPVKPEYSSYLPGMGYVILRDRFSEPDETFFFATFGPELGTSNRTMHHQPSHGDFSLIWKGNPILLTRGCSSYVWSRRMRDQVDFSHSVVTFDGAGESLAIPEKKYSIPAVEVNASVDENLVRDFYPDGITNYISTPGFDYAAGQIRNWDISIPASFNVRHFIFLKPDVFLIWDQVRSSYPIARQLLGNNHKGAGKILENLLSYPSRPKRIGLIETDGQMEAVIKKLGFTFELLDYNELEGDLSRFDRIVVGHFAVLVRDRDMVDYREKLWKYVEDGGVCYWAYQYAWGWKPGDTSGPGYFPKTLMVGEGTSILWGEGIELNCPVEMDDDPIWNFPNKITMEDWNGWQIGRPDTFKVMPLYAVKPNTDRARNIPVYYSDHWRVHASARKTYNINIPSTRSRFGPYRWIKVHHKPSDDFFTVLRPWVNGNKPSAEIIRGTETEAVITQGDDYWRILLGKHPGFTGNLSLLRYKNDRLKISTTADKKQKIDQSQLQSVTPQEIFLVDALDASVADLRFTFEHSATFFFNVDESYGELSTLDGGKITLPWKLKKVTLSGRSLKKETTPDGTEINLTAGEYNFTLNGDILSLTRKCFVGRVEVVDTDGNPMQWIHIFRDLSGKKRTLFQGATDAHGFLTLRWDGKAKQRITLKKGKDSIRKNINPGVQKIVFE